MRNEPNDPRVDRGPALTARIACGTPAAGTRSMPGQRRAGRPAFAAAYAGSGEPLNLPRYMVACSAKFHDYEDILIVSEADNETQLQVWKDLAISKQILMTAATKALGLNSECSTEELQSALDQAIQRAGEADGKVAAMREQTDKELATMKSQLRTSEAALAEAREQVAEATKAREAIERQLTVGKSENAKALKEAKAEVAEHQRKLKAISKLLADTPENVIKKLKNLKKQKLDDTRVRTQIETKLRSTTKEKVELEQKLEAQNAQLEQTAPLLEKLREMHDSCMQANKKIESLSDDKPDLSELPTLDSAQLEILEQATASEQVVDSAA